MADLTNLAGHGEDRKKITKVGKTSFIKREKFCRLHGWVDLFLFPNFETDHGKCGVAEQGVELTLKKAA